MKNLSRVIIYLLASGMGILHYSGVRAGQVSVTKNAYARPDSSSPENIAHVIGLTSAGTVQVHTPSSTPNLLIDGNGYNTGSFEQTAFSEDYVLYPNASLAIVGWTVIVLGTQLDNFIDVTRTQLNWWAASEGSQFLDLTAYVGYNKGIQSHPINVIAGQKYRLSFDIGDLYIYRSSVGVSFDSGHWDDGTTAEKVFLSSAQPGSLPMTWKTIMVDWVADHTGTTKLSFFGRDPGIKGYPSTQAGFPVSGTCPNPLPNPNTCPGEIAAGATWDFSVTLGLPIGGTVPAINFDENIAMDNVMLTAVQTLPNHKLDDTNADGKSDLLWRNSSKGQNYLFTMNGTTFTEAAINTLSTDWQIKGKGDYNGDGKADILWRNSSTGANYIYHMNGAAYTEVSLGIVPPVWEVAGSGDFNADGRADILWRNNITGDNYLYLMNADGSYTANYINTIANTDWKIKGTGDYNGDGKADVLWRNSTTGVNALFTMNGASVTSIDVINTISDLLWDIKGSGDFNGDGKSDILWRNSSTGTNALFIMNGATASSIDLIDTIADQNWQIKGTGDYNGDGKADILWRNGSSGVNYLYFMNGAVATPAYLNTLADTNWQVGYVQ